jgi:hypothetical protein
LDENDIIIISWVTDKIQQMAMQKNCEITADAARGRGGKVDCNPWLLKMKIYIKQPIQRFRRIILTC